MESNLLLKKHSTVENTRFLLNRFLQFGYEIKMQRGLDFISLYKPFNNSDTPINGGEQLQIGRSILIYNNSIFSQEYMKRGWLWSGSAETQQRKGNVYAIGEERLIARF